MKYAITNPCHEDWNKMKIGLISRHCDFCQKSVMDFTQMRRDQIIEYLLSHTDERVCGHIYPHQFDFKEEEILVAVKKYVRKNPKTNLAFYVLAIGAMMAASCSNGGTSAPKNSPNPQIQAIDSTAKNTANQPVNTETELDSTDHFSSDNNIIDLKNIPDLGQPTLPQLEGEVLLTEPIDTPPVIDPESFYPLGNEPDSVIVQFPEVQSEFPGGVEALFKFVRDSLEIPAHITELQTDVRVYVRFVVSKSGKISNVEILRNTNPDSELEKNVEEMVLSMPEWTPGKVKGEPVHSFMIIPIKIWNDRR
ncbi:MAG: energy transducer TonB [Flavobacteriia bacterium]|nr:energy transducer TonB [Flavobacteriia bacterium]